MSQKRRAKGAPGSEWVGADVVKTTVESENRIEGKKLTISSNSLGVVPDDFGYIVFENQEQILDVNTCKQNRNYDE